MATLKKKLSWFDYMQLAMVVAGLIQEQQQTTADGATKMAKVVAGAKTVIKIIAPYASKNNPNLNAQIESLAQTIYDLLDELDAIATPPAPAPGV